MASPPITRKEFTDIIQKHSALINKVCYFYASDQLPFEDLRQEVYLNIWQALPQFRGESKLSTWLYRIAVNSALMVIRSSKTKMETVSMDFGLLNVSSEIDDIQKENLQAMYSIINRLENIEKAIILLWLDEHSYEEIGETLGMNRNTVATKIRRIKEKLSKSM